MLDEPAGALDEEHREKMALWLEELKSKAKTILFATHVDLGAELFDNELQVVKENDLSHITQDIGFREAVMELIPEEL
jgi:DNA repair exonuclease SbcCD ATPase subunit